MFTGEYESIMCIALKKSHHYVWAFTVSIEENDVFLWFFLSLNHHISLLCVYFSEIKHIFFVSWYVSLIFRVFCSNSPKSAYFDSKMYILIRQPQILHNMYIFGIYETLGWFGKPKCFAKCSKICIFWYHESILK